MWQANWKGTWNALVHMKRRMFVRLQELDFAFHSNKSSGSIISILKQGETAFIQMGIDFHFVTVPVILEVIVV